MRKGKILTGIMCLAIIMFYFSHNALCDNIEDGCGPDRVVVSGRVDSQRVKNGWVYFVTCNVPGPAYCCIPIDVE